MQEKLLLSASDLGGDLSSEVVNLLLNAFTLNEVDSVDEGDLAAQLLGSVGDPPGTAYNGSVRDFDNQGWLDTFPEQYRAAEWWS